MTRVQTHHDPDVSIDEQTLSGFGRHCAVAADRVRTTVVTELRIAQARPYAFGGDDSPWGKSLSEAWNRYLENREQEAEDVRGELRYLGAITSVAAGDYDHVDELAGVDIDETVLDRIQAPR